MDGELLTSLAICLAIQAIFFAFAATLRTDKVTDLSYEAYVRRTSRLIPQPPR
jgi:hypothetical protein